MECVLLVAFARHEAGDDRQSGKPVGAAMVRVSGTGSATNRESVTLLPPEGVALPAFETELAADDVCSVVVVPRVI